MPPPDKAPPEYGAVADLAIATLHYFGTVWQPGQPEYLLGTLLAGTPHATASAIETALREKNRYRAAPLDLSRVEVNLRGWSLTGLTFMVSGIRKGAEA